MFLKVSRNRKRMPTYFFAVIRDMHSCTHGFI